MKAPTRFLFMLAFLPLLFLPSTVRADETVITGGSCSFEHVLTPGGSFFFTNKAQSFHADGAMDNANIIDRGLIFRAGQTVSPNTEVMDILGGSTTINGATFSPVFYEGGLGPNSDFTFTGDSFVLPPRDPSLPPDQHVVVTFAVPFTFSGTLTGYPCSNGPIGRPVPHSQLQSQSPANCFDPLFTTQLSGKGVATIKFVNYSPANPNDHIYELQSVVYEFGSSTSLSTLSAGSGAQKFAFTISEHGNLRDIESPQNFKHLSTREGYALCSTVSTAAFDDGEVDAGWGAPVISRPGGANTLPLTITRTTLDGRFQLKQLFEWDSNQREVNITMSLKNLSGGAVAGVKLARYFDGDIDRDQNDDRYAAISDSVWGWDDGSGPNHHGLMLTALSTSFQHALAVEKFSAWAATGAGAQTARSCTPASIATPTAPGDYVGRLTYNLGTIPAGASKTVKLQYKRL